MSALPSRDPDPAEPDPQRPAEVPLADVQGTLAFDLQPRLDPPQPDRSGQDDALLAEPIPIVPARGHLNAWIPQFAQKIAEVVGGDRPASQLVRWTTKEVVADLRYRAALTARSGAYEPGLGRHQPVRPRVYRWHLHVVTDTIVEATATIKYGHGYRAMALRSGGMHPVPLGLRVIAHEKTVTRGARYVRGTYSAPRVRGLRSLSR